MHDQGDQPSDDPGAARPDRRKRGRLWPKLAALTAIVVVLAVVAFGLVGRQYRVPSVSMEPTLQGPNDRIYVAKPSYWWGDPKPGDVVIFTSPESWNKNKTATPPDLVKRVIAVGGQTVQCCDAQGRVLVDGKPLDEPYVQRDHPWPDGRKPYPFGRVFGPITVPDRQLWVMGDSRFNSLDSRGHTDTAQLGTVPVDNVVGKVVFKFWPLGRMGPVRSQNPQGN